MNKLIAGLGAAAALLLLAGCPNPINGVDLNEMVDQTAPVVTISSPADGTAYSQTVTVAGSATDAGKVRTVSYQVSGTLGLLVSGTITAAQLGGEREGTRIAASRLERPPDLVALLREVGDVSRPVARHVASDVPRAVRAFRGRPGGAGGSRRAAGRGPAAGGRGVW